MDDEGLMSSQQNNGEDEEKLEQLPFHKYIGVRVKTSTVRVTFNSAWFIEREREKTLCTKQKQRKFSLVLFLIIKYHVSILR